jgi:two-component system OmpR family sensor kinase
MSLRQAVDNLLVNARTHTPAGTAVTVRVRRSDGDAVIEVVDAGPGLDAVAADHVFERFYRADASRSRDAGGGSGLGLAIVAAIAEAHGGRATVVTAEGAGATFALHLPLTTP